GHLHRPGGLGAGRGYGRVRLQFRHGRRKGRELGQLGVGAVPVWRVVLDGRIFGGGLRGALGRGGFRSFPTAEVDDHVRRAETDRDGGEGASGGGHEAVLDEGLGHGGGHHVEDADVGADRRFQGHLPLGQLQPDALLGAGHDLSDHLRRGAFHLDVDERPVGADAQQVGVGAPVVDGDRGGAVLGGAEFGRDVGPVGGEDEDAGGGPERVVELEQRVGQPRLGLGQGFEGAAGGGHGEHHGGGRHITGGDQEPAGQGQQDRRQRDRRPDEPSPGQADNGLPEAHYVRPRRL